ncbi:hypothetical protein GCM10023231_40240 [Olivibacter ginsenosidimutans]|uniref:Efflux RND transporter periplasmic adaptor subunit n=1 Tax=Olivibacter ginsenosidimutans TaxID=1176537 RepID=A0ABP9CCC9_9SPHI
MLLLVTACTPNRDHTTDQKVHTHNTVDSSVRQLAQATNQQVVAQVATIQAKKGLQVFPVQVTGKVNYDSRNNTSISSRVSGRLERIYVKYNYQPVHKGQLLLEIYSPELVSAQRELLLLRNTQQQALMLAAMQKLQYLGMSTQQVQQVLKTGTVLYRIPIYSTASGYILEKSKPVSAAPAANSSIITGNAEEMDAMNASSTASMQPPPPTRLESSPILLREGQYVNTGQGIFTIYTNTDLIAEFAFPSKWATKVFVGKKILFQNIDQPQESYQGEIGLIQPTFNAGENFSIARVYLKGIKLPVGQLLKGTLAFSEKEGFWVPKQAVVQLGNTAVVFKKEQGIFKAVPIQTGISTQEEVQVISNIEHWQLAKNAAYLVDSEDFVLTDKRVGDE